MIDVPDFERPGFLRVDNRHNLKKFVNNRVVEISEEERNAACDALELRIIAYLRNASLINVNDLAVANNNGYTYVENGIDLDPPPPVIEWVRVKEGTSHENFQKRKAAGEIMMSDYETSKFSIKRTAGLRKGTMIAHPRVRLNNSGLVSAGILVPKDNSSWPPWVLISGTPYRYDGNVYGSIAVYYRIRSTFGGWAFPPALEGSEVLSALRSHKPEVTQMVTEALATINRSSVDVLTAFAEAPKSILSVIRGFRLVADMLRDAKKGQFDLTKAHAIRKKRMNDRLKTRLARIDKELRNPKLSLKRRKALENHRNVIYIRHRDTLLKASDELASSLADLWLNYRYNIMPNVYLAQDVFDATMKYGRKWITSRGTVGGPASIPIKDFRMDVDVISRVTLKRNFSSRLHNVHSVISNDIFVTAWELVPLSFVYDWFINFGDLLAAQNYQVTWDQAGSVLSKSIKFNAQVDNRYKTVEYLIEPTTTIAGFYYKRTRINPNDYCGLVWQPTVGLERQVDLISLAWRPVRSLLLQRRSQ